MRITAEVFEGHLKCQTKCWLRAINEPFSGNSYSEWVNRQNILYRTVETEKLVASSPAYQTKLLTTTGSLKLENWCPSIGLTVQKKINNGVLESELHAIEQVPSKIRDQLVELSPIRFFFNNKLGNDDKLLLAFDAFVLSESLGRKIKVGKIIHGDNSKTLRVNVSVLSAQVQKHIEKIIETLSSPTPPELVLIRHCAECEFRNHCHQNAKESDDLSLLSGMSEKV